MAWYPAAIRRELPQNKTQPVIRAVGVVLHTAVSNGTSLFTFFNGRSSGVESHFYVREDGTVEQYMDTTRRADCQRDGNYFDGKGFLSVETWDGGHPETTPWNAKQVAAITDLIEWICRTHNVPAIKATGAQGTGIGYHAQFTSDSYPRWNKDHSCPTTTRIPQVPGITAAVRARLEGDNDMPITDDDAKRIARHVLTVDGVIPNVGNKDNPFMSLAGGIADLEKTQDEHGAHLAAIRADLDAIKSAGSATAAMIAAAIRSDPAFLAAIANAVNDDQSRRLQT